MKNNIELRKNVNCIILKIKSEKYCKNGQKEIGENCKK